MDMIWRDFGRRDPETVFEFLTLTTIEKKNKQL